MLGHVNALSHLVFIIAINVVIVIDIILGELTKAQLSELMANN